MFLAGSIVMILSMLTLIGTLISDILLAWLDLGIRESDLALCRLCRLSCEPAGLERVIHRGHSRRDLTPG